MTVKINDNFLEQKEINYFKKAILKDNFPWFLAPVTSNDDSLYKQFIHIFYGKHNFNSTYKKLIIPILNKLKPTAIYRIKLNLLTKTQNVVEHPFHIDHKSKNTVSSILYLNTNDGYTGFKDHEKCFSTENRLITFPSYKLHHGSTCTDRDFRIALNMVYIK